MLAPSGRFSGWDSYVYIPKSVERYFRSTVSISSSSESDQQRRPVTSYSVYSIYSLALKNQLSSEGS